MIDLTQFLLEIVGVFIGAFAAFELDNYREHQDEKKQSIRILKLLKRELEVNVRVMIPTIRDNVEKMGVPFAPLSFAIWEATSNKINTIANDNVLRAISNAYYNMHTLDKALDRFRSYVTGYLSAPDEKVKRELVNRVNDTTGIILEHIREPKDAKDRTISLIINEAIIEIEKELRRLDG